MKLKEINKLPWPENLLRRIFMDEEYAKWKAHIPPDFDASFQYILEETLTEGETYILYSFYRNRMRLRVIGERYGIKADRCAQIKEKAIRRIRHPSRYKYLKYGMAEVSKREMEPTKVVPVEEGDIAELDLSVRAFNCLRRANIKRIEQLTLLTRLDLMKINNMGKGSIAEVERKLAEKGLSLKQDYT